MKNIFIPLIVIFAFLLSLNRFKLFSLNEMSIFLTVVGLIYGLIAAFTINNVWERYSKIRDAVASETSSLATIFFFAKNLTDKKVYEDMKTTIESYCRLAPEIEWHDYMKNQECHQKFRFLQRRIAEVKLKTNTDKELFQNIAEEMRIAATARNQQLVLAQTKLTKIQWVLNIFLSVILVFGLTFLDIPNSSVSLFIITTMIIAVLLILLIIYELDSLKINEREFSVEPYEEVVRIISQS